VNLNGDLEALQKIVDGALASLEASRQRIDDLNVYPVPDGDTGTNLTMTVRAVAEAVEHTSAGSRQSLARDVARGALMGARELTAQRPLHPHDAVALERRLRDDLRDRLRRDRDPAERRCGHGLHRSV